MRDNLLIISHRRSGTHLTIDAIRNNFACFRKRDLLTLETLQPAHGEHSTVPEFKNEIEQKSRVVKTHYLPVFEDLLPAPASQRLVNQVYRSAKKIYVVRSGLDVLTSLYEFRKSHCQKTRQLSFADFLRLPTFDPEHRDLNKVQYWCKHIRDWLSSEFGNELMIVKFEDWILRYKETLQRVASFLGKKPNWKTVDVRLGRQENTRIKRTTVVGRKGGIGDFSNAFSPRDLDLFFEHATGVMSKLGYEHGTQVAVNG